MNSGTVGRWARRLARQWKLRVGRRGVTPIFVRLPLWMAILAAMKAQANPNGMTVVSGTATANQQGNQLNIKTSQKAFLRWQSFNIAPGEKTIFQQPSATSIVFNKITDQNPSTIFGSLQANGVVVLENANGLYFGPNSFVKSAGLIATTASVTPIDAGAGMSFKAPPVSASIVNYGRLETSSGGSLYLIAKQVENHGTLSAPGGGIGLLGGEEVLLSERPDGLGLSVRVRVPQGAVNNQGQLVADAGRVMLEAQTVNQEGMIRANSIGRHNGVIELYASDQVNLSAQSKIQADGDAQGNSRGGEVTIKSDGVFKDTFGSLISASGGVQGGDGGKIEVSATKMASLQTHLTAAAVSGFKAGDLVIDPTDIILSSSGSGNAGNGTVNAGDSPDTLQLDVGSAFSGFSHITLQATHNITLDTTWDLPNATGKDELGCKLTLQAGNDINLTGDSSIMGGNYWSVSLTSGANFGSAGGVNSGTGSIVLGSLSPNGALFGNATVQTGSGSIDLTAGRNITLATGAVRTTGGGSISAVAMGNVDCGSNPNGFTFVNSGVGYSVNPNLGGISTAAGGDVFIRAGGDVKAFLPPSGTTPNTTGDAGTGAFGAQPGNVTVEAVGNVTGHFVVRNGIGSIESTAGNVGTQSKMLALSLVSGDWNIKADTGSILLQEVRNPNGVFNASRNSSLQYYFDYDPKASVSLIAGNGVVLSGQTLPRGRGNFAGPIYPPKMSICAGAGGVVLGSSISLFPSQYGSLDITTTEGGDLCSSVKGTIATLDISDSDKRQWTSITDFTEADPGQTLLHLNDPTPVTLDISGSIRDFRLISPKVVHMTAGRDILDSSLTVQNLKPTDETTITAGGKIQERSSLTYVYLTGKDAKPDFSLFAEATDPTIQSIASKFSYNPVNKRLGFMGLMTLQEENALLNMQVQMKDGTIKTAPFVDPSIIQQLYAMSQDVPQGALQGFEVSGPGTLKIKAASLDLGMSPGVISHGLSGNPALTATVFPNAAGVKGADIDIDLTGNLDMYSSTIMSEYGGNVEIHSGGAINVGFQELLGNSLDPRGIITLWGGNIEVIADQTVSVNGSRIAAYDGGNIHVKSLNGNVDAGAGGTGYVRIIKPYFDPVTGEILYAGSTIPGSGILATSFPIDVPGQPSSRVGDIAIETPKGDILASQGGIVQIALGHVDSRSATITLNAGSEEGGVTYRGNINADHSGVVGENIDMKATGNINGVVVGSQGVQIDSKQNVNVTAISGGGLKVSAVGTISGTIAGLGGVSVSGSDISAALMGNVSASGTLSGAAAAAPSAGPTSQEASQAAKDVTEKSDTTKDLTSEESDENRKKKRPGMEYVGRVTVIMPKEL